MCVWFFTVFYGVKLKNTWKIDMLTYIKKRKQLKMKTRWKLHHIDINWLNGYANVCDNIGQWVRMKKETENVLHDEWYEWLDWLLQIKRN